MLPPRVIPGINAPLGTQNSPLIVNQSLLFSSAYQTPIQAAKAGTQTPVLVLGNSIPFGYKGASTNGQVRYNGWANRLSALLAAAGVRSSAQGWLGNGNLHSTGAATVYDDRQTNGAPAWGNGVSSLGGTTMSASAAATWSFVPKNQDGSSFNCDSFDLYYLRFSGGGTLGVAFDGGAVTNVSTNGLTAVIKRAFTGLSLAGHTQTISWVSNNPSGMFFMGADAFDSSTVGFKFINGAISGGVFQDFNRNTNYYDAVNAAIVVAPSIIFCMIGANYWNAAASVATFQSELATFISLYSAIGQVVLISDVPSNPATRAALSAQKLYVDVMIAAARQNNLLMFNEWQAFGGLSANFDSRWTDDVHPSATGHQQIAQDIATPFLAAA
jgi:lysophospholipase L1-like esterase